MSRRTFVIPTNTSFPLVGDVGIGAAVPSGRSATPHTSCKGYAATLHETQQQPPTCPQTEHLSRMRGSGAELRGADLLPPPPRPAHLIPGASGSHGPLVPNCTRFAQSLRFSADDTDIHALDANFDHMIEDPLLTPLADAHCRSDAFSHHEIDTFLSGLPMDSALDAGDELSHENDDIIQQILSELDNHAAPQAGHAAGRHDDVPDMAAALDSLLEESGMLLLEDGGISIEDLMDFGPKNPDSLSLGAASSAVDTSPEAPSASTHGDELPPEATPSSPLRATRLAQHSKQARARVASPCGKKASRARSKQLPQAIVTMLKAGGTHASQVRAAIARSQKWRGRAVQRSQRVNHSFLAVADPVVPSVGAAALAGRDNGAAKAVKGVSKPEVVKRAPLTVQERLNSLYQSLVEARKEWDEKANLLKMLLSSGKRDGAHDDRRLMQLRSVVQLAADRILAASGRLLLERVELRIGRLPDQQVYYCKVEGKQQGPYTAAQLSKLLAQKIVPETCNVLIDLAYLGGISVHVPAGALKPLLSQPSCMSHGQPYLHELAGFHDAPRAPPPPRRPPTLPAGTQGSAGNKRGRGHEESERNGERPAGGKNSRGRGGLARFDRGSSGHLSAGWADHHRVGEEGRREGSREACRDDRANRHGGARWRDQGPSWRRRIGADLADLITELPASKAAEWLHEERTAEVYIYGDGHGFILGPFCINELQLQIERKTITDKQELMFETEYGTTVTTVAELFRSIHERHAQIVRTETEEVDKSPRSQSHGSATRHTAVRTAPEVSVHLEPSSTDETAAATSLLPESPRVTTTTAHAAVAVSTTSAGRAQMLQRPAGAPPPLEAVAPPPPPAEDTSIKQLLSWLPAANPGLLEPPPTSPSASQVGATPPTSQRSDSSSLTAPPASASPAGAPEAIPGLPALPPGQPPPAVEHVAELADPSGGTLWDPVRQQMVILPSGFESFNEMLAHVSENGMEPMKQRLLHTSGAQRPKLMARLDYHALKAFSDAPVHVAELALAEFIKVGTVDAAPAELFASLLKQHGDYVHFRGFRAAV